MILFVNSVHESMPMVRINVDKGQFYHTFNIQRELLKWRAGGFFKHLKDHCNGRQEGPFQVYDLPDEHRNVFEWILKIIVDRRLPESIPQLRASRLSSMVEIYVAAHRLRFDKVMNMILDGFLIDINSNNIFPPTLVVDIYQLSIKGCGLRQWFLEQVTISVDAEDFENFGDYWPHDALVELAVHCMGRFVPPLHLTDMSKFYQASFPTEPEEE